jgi:hypothetical protein
MKNVGIFYGHLEYRKAIWYILWSFGIGIFSLFGMFCQEKSGNIEECYANCPISR